MPTFEQALHDHEMRDAERHGEIMRELGKISGKLDGHSDRIDRIEDREEVTGSHTLKKAEDTSHFWRDTIAKVIVGVLVLVAGGVGAVVWSMVRR